MPPRIRGDLSDRVRRFCLLSISQRRLLAAAIRADAAGIPVRLQSSRTDYLQAVSQPPTVWRARRLRESILSRLLPAARGFSAAPRIVSGKDRGADFRIRRIRQ